MREKIKRRNFYIKLATGDVDMLRAENLAGVFSQLGTANLVNNGWLTALHVDTRDTITVNANKIVSISEDY